MSHLDQLKDWFHRGKDASASIVLEKFIRERLAQYGRIVGLSLDSRRRTIRLEVHLHGEPDSITIAVDEFQLVEEAGATQFVVRRASASREWIQRLIEDFIIGRPFIVPEKYAWLAKMFAGS